MATTIAEDILGQVRPPSSVAVTLYTLPALSRGIFKGLRVCNTTSGKVKYSIFAHKTGTTYDESTAIAFEVELDGNDFEWDDTFKALGTAGGTIGVRSSVPNALTFTLFGAEVT